MSKHELVDLSQIPPDLKKVSAYLAGKNAFIQGPGGNISYKDENGLLWIKASGFLIEDILQGKGVAVVNQQEALNRLFEAADVYPESEYNARIALSVVPSGEEGSRPSMETGFHVALGKNVLHCHSVFANIVLCSTTGRQVIENLFSGKPYPFHFIPYQNPGLNLTNAIKPLSTKEQDVPVVFFLENHGMIVSGENVQEVIKIHQEVNAVLQEAFGVAEEALQFSLLPLKGEEEWEAHLPFVHLEEVLHRFGSQFLFPDQVIFFQKYFLGEAASRLRVDPLQNKIFIKHSRREATTIAEILTCFAVIYQYLLQAGLTIKELSPEDIAFVGNMDMEKYRKQMLEKQSQL